MEDGYAPLHTILAHLLGKQQNEGALQQALEQVANNDVWRDKFEALLLKIEVSDEARWLEKVAAVLDGLTLDAPNENQLVTSQFMGLVDQLKNEPFVDLTVDLPTFPSFAQQQSFAQQAFADQQVGKTAEVDTRWTTVPLSMGQGLKDKITGQWGQVTLSLQGLFINQGRASALSGLMDADSAKEEKAAFQNIAISPDDANFELSLSVRNHQLDAALCHLEIAVTLFDRLGDFSGVSITLSWADHVYSQETDEQGKTTFERLPRSMIEAMTVQVSFPSD